MITRTYYFPRSQVARYILSCIINKVGCSIGAIRINTTANVLAVPITCRELDVSKIEKILKMYNLLD